MNGITWLGGDELSAHRQVVAGDAPGADRGPGRLTPRVCPDCALRWVRMVGCGACRSSRPGAAPLVGRTDAAAARSPEEPPTAPRPAPEPPTRPGAEAPDPYAPRRRYPWHDDPQLRPGGLRRHRGSGRRRPGAAVPGLPGTGPRRRSRRRHHRCLARGQPRYRAGTAHHRDPAAPRRRADHPGRLRRPPRSGPRTAQTRGLRGPPRGTTRKPRRSPIRRTPAHATTAGASRSARRAKLPRKITVTRVAAMRSRQFAEGTVRAFHRAATADGADRSGLTALTYATMMTLRGRRGGRRRAGQHAVLRRRQGRERHERRALPGDNGGAVRRGRAGDRSAARPRAARPPRRARPHVRPARGARRRHGVPVPHLAALPGRAGHAGAVEVVRRAQGGGHAAGAAAARSRWSPRTPASPRSASPRAGCPAESPPGVAWLWGSEGALVFTALLAVVGTVCCACGSRSGSSRRRARSPPRCGGTRRGAAHPDGPRRRGRALGQRRDPRAHGIPHAVRRVRRQADRRRAHPAALAHRDRRRRGRGRLVRGNAAGSRPRALSGVVVLWCVGAAVVVAALAAALPGIATAAVGRARRGGRERAGQGQPGCGDPARSAGGVARVGVRPVGDGAAAGLGDGRSARRAAAARHVLDRVHGRGERGRADRRADRAALPRSQHRPVPRRQGPAGGADGAREPS